MIKTTLCYIKKNNQYLMLLRNKKEHDLNDGKWIGLGGKFRKKESPDACLLREVREEAGIRLTKYHFHGIIYFYSDTWEDEEMYLYSASDFDGEVVGNCDEGELHWINEDKVMDLNLWEGDRLFLPKLLSGVERFSMSLRYEGDKLVEYQDYCGNNGLCGGCAYGGMGYEAQLKDKEKKLLDLLLPVFDAESIWDGMYESPLHERYKNKMEYSFGDEVKDGPLTLGMHRKKSFYSVLPCDDCRLVHEDFNRIVQSTMDYFGRLRVSYFSKRDHSGYLRHLVLRRSFASGDVMVDLVTADLPGDVTGLSETELLAGWMKQLMLLNLDGRISGILHTRNNSWSDAVTDEGTELLYGTGFIEETLLGLKFKITPFSFFQTNSKGAEVLYSRVREYIGDVAGKTVYDLYSGTGTIAQTVASVAEKVYGVEIIPEAVEAAKENAIANGLNNAEFLAGDVLDVIDNLDRKPDFIILDPPRDGLHPKMLSKIANFGVKNIIYVACKPESFCRDMGYFRTCGYRVARACGVDQFPYTKHVETVALLTRT